MTIGLIIICCWVVSFFFNGIESGLLSIDPVRLRHNAKRRIRPALRLQRLLKNPGRLLGTVLIVTNAADIIGLLLLTREFYREFGRAGFFYALIAMLPIYLFLLSILPKALFRRFPFRALARLAGVLELVSLFLAPVLEIGAWIGRVLLPARVGRRRLFAGREELKQIAVQSEHEGALTATERAMIHNIFDFRAVNSRDVMIPATNVVAIRPDTTIDEAVELGLSSGIDRLPVLTREGHPVGLVDVFDLLVGRNGDRSLGQFTRRIVIADEDEPAYRIIQRLRAARFGVAGVLDQEKKLRGVILIEDLIRRLISVTEARA
ncbi:MAG TPA: CNNM domain-containing protein [Chthoniobacterales bacterium]|nr:CNNM domain-containing protein [Chthoniobacterales bacterium]